MTEKRFTIDGYSDVNKIDDNQTEDFFIIANGLDTWKLCDLLNALHEENEQLKNNIKEVVELLSEEVDLFSDKATEHDICAYIELKELDNKDAYYMAISTKKAVKMLKDLLK